MKKSLMILLAVAGLALPAQASVQQVRVLAVGVDQLSSNAEAKAIDYARKRAVYLTARKLAVTDPGGKVAALSDKQFNEIIRGASVLRTKRVHEVTYAEVMVTVIDEPLQKALGITGGKASTAEGGNEADLRGRGVMVLPVFVKASRPYVWERENELREPLRGEVLRQSRGGVVMPAGDYDDLRLVDYQNVLEVKAADLVPMFTRYGADEIVIAIYTAAAGDGSAPGSILLRRLTPKEARSEVLSLEMPTDVKLPERTLAAARVIAGAVAQIAASTAEADQKRLAAATKIPVRFLYANPRELAQMQEKLRNAPGVLQLATPSIALNDIAAHVYVEGEVKNLRENLAKQAIIVTEQGDTWQLSLR